MRVPVPSRAGPAAVAASLVLAVLAASCRADGDAQPPADPPGDVTLAPADTGTVDPSDTPADVTLAPADRAADAGRSPEPLRWVALGDSYSSGQGGPADVVAPLPGCPRAEPDTYARRAVERLTDRTVSLTVRACGGALLGDVLDGQLDAVDGADVVTLTVGGNDAGFLQLTGACLSDACPDLTAEDAALPLVRNPTPGDGRTDWQVLGDQLQATYGAIVERMAPAGRLLVLTYPLPFPERQQSCPTGFSFVDPLQAGLVNAAITRLDDLIVTAAAAADAVATADRRVLALEWRTPTGRPDPTTITSPDGRMVPSGWNPAGICGTDPMLNGLRLDAEVEDSFHPSDRGIDIAAELVAAEVRRRS